MSRRALFFVLMASGWSAFALNFRTNDAIDYAQEAARFAVAAESYCTDLIGRDGRCTYRAGRSPQAVQAMNRAAIAIEGFYLKCEIVMRGDRSICDVMMGAFLNEARDRNGTAP